MVFSLPSLTPVMMQPMFVYTTDEFDPDPYMQMLNEYGLPWVVEENPETVA